MVVCTAAWRLTRYLLVVEKDAVFQRLAEDGLPDALPLVMVTAKGMPDLATRAFCSRLLVGGASSRGEQTQDRPGSGGGMKPLTELLSQAGRQAGWEGDNLSIKQSSEALLVIDDASLP
jgi:hypothetical protein